MAASQDHGRSRGLGAVGAPMDTPGWGWVGALLSQDSLSGLVRDDPSANKTFLKSLFQKSNIYLAGTVSLQSQPISATLDDAKNPDVRRKAFTSFILVERPGF